MESEQRWAAARGLAEGVPDRRMPRRRWQLFALLLTVMVLGGIAGGVLAPSLSSATGGTESDAFTSSQLIGYLFFAVGLVTGIVGFIWAKRTGRYIPRWRQAISALNRRERKWVTKQLRGKIPPDPAKLDILLTIAKQSCAVTEGVIPIWAALALMNVGLAIASDADTRWFLLLAAGLLTMGAALMAVDYRRWGLFIGTHEDASRSDHPGVAG
ncbi:hypothetical protein [Planctomonas deserti]|uniref:hypothetical protein n=1 Tax=Planctomonas deserti TaxID=2144185 RepID=UPI000D34540D|nr:hypothetical protein [Planctomonas deserti]